MKTTHDTIRIIRCRIGSEHYALEMSTVPSVRQLAEVVTTASGEHAAQLGVLPVAGSEPVPVFSLAERLGRPEPDVDGRQHVVVAQTSRGPLALVVDTVSHVHAVSTSRLINLPPLLSNPSRRIVKNIVDFADVEDGDATRESDMSLLLSPERLHPSAAPVTPDPRRKKAAEEPATGPGLSVTRRHGQIVLMSVTEEISDTLPVLGLSVTQIAEILEPKPVIPVPFSADDVPGFVVWRNQPVPMINVGRRVGLSTVPASDRLVVARGQGNSALFAFLAQSRMRPLRLPIEASPIDIPAELSGSAIRAAFTVDSATVLVPDMTSITSTPAACV